jgi:ferrochelatase
MTTGVLCMAYGSPDSLDDVAAYIQDIRGGRAPGADAVAALTERYRRIGGQSPLLDITMRQAARLGELLGCAVGVGMKHWRPSIADAVESFGALDTLVGLALAPHYAAMSIGGYEDRVRKAVANAGRDCDVRMVHAWYDEPSFVAFAADTLTAAVGAHGTAGTRVIFTAHSLPERILAQGDPYRDQLLESARLVAERAGVTEYELAFQSASHTGEPWLGPHVLDRVDAAGRDGVRRVVVHPIGFTADHLEILYDVDVECAARAATAGIAFARTPSPNDQPAFIAALADVVRRALQ